MMRSVVLLLMLVTSSVLFPSYGQNTLEWRKKSSQTQKENKWYDDIINSSKKKKKKYPSSKKSNQSESQAKVSAQDGETYHNTHKSALSGSDIFRKYNTSVFMILTQADDKVYQGSGFFINSSGLAVSNAHVFENAEAVIVKKPGYDKYYKVDKVYYYDREADFILFHVDVISNMYIPIAQETPKVGDKVFAIGSPKGLENTFASGEISQLRGTDKIQISIPIDHGSSGGALINEYGEVIGITTGGYESNANLNFAVSIEPIKQLLSY